MGPPALERCCLLDRNPLLLQPALKVLKIVFHRYPADFAAEIRGASVIVP